jgi:hypothetical protein
MANESSGDVVRLLLLSRRSSACCFGVGPFRFDQLGVGPDSRGFHAVGRQNVSVLRAHGDQLHTRQPF